MILVRNVFQVQFGKSKEAVALWMEGLAVQKRIGFNAKSTRLLTDLVGNYYTIVFEMTFESLADFENAGKTVMAKKEWQDWYARIVPLTQSGHREIFNIVSE